MSEATAICVSTKSSVLWRLAVSSLVLAGTVLIAQWGWAAYQTQQIQGPFLAWVCMGISVVQLAWYTVAKKAELNNRAVWQGRDAAFTALIMTGTSLLLLATALLTGGPQVTTHELSWNSGFWIPVLATGLLNVVIQFANVRAMALEDVSLVGPISSTTPAVVIVIGMMILGEYPGWYGWAGIWLLAIGTYSLQINDLFEKLSAQQTAEVSPTLEEVVSRSPGWRYWLSLWLAPITALKASAGVRWAFLAVLFACFSLNYDALVARNANVAFASACVFGIAGFGNLLWALRRKEFNGLDPLYAFSAVVLLVVLFAMLHIVLNLAFRATLMSHIGALKRLAIPLTIIGAYCFLGERKKFTGRLIGGAIMAVGAILVSLDM